jgi:hypothetical protein
MRLFAKPLRPLANAHRLNAERNGASLEWCLLA